MSETNLRSVDYTALTAPIDLAEVAEFEAETDRARRWLPRRGGGISPLLVVLTLIFLAGPLLVLTAILLDAAIWGWWGVVIAFAPACVTFIMLAGMLILPALRAPRRAFGWEQHYRLSRFAWDNGLNFETEQAKPKYPGVMFTNLPSVVYNHLTPKSGRFFDIGNLRYGQLGSDNAMSESGHRGFLAIYLGGLLPHIVLDAKSNDGMWGGIGVGFAGQPILSLEGDFNSYFTLYCPIGYERDALYIFTPDLMADLVDDSLAFDVELINEWMFVYAMEPFDSTDPAIYERLFRIVETVGRRATRRATTYHDDQYSSPQAAAAKPAGRRMPMKIPRKFVMLIVAFIASLSWIPIGLFLGFLPQFL